MPFGSNRCHVYSLRLNFVEMKTSIGRKKEEEGEKEFAFLRITNDTEIFFTRERILDTTFGVRACVNVFFCRDDKILKSRDQSRAAQRVKSNFVKIGAAFPFRSHSEKPFLFQFPYAGVVFLPSALRKCIAFILCVIRMLKNSAYFVKVEGTRFRSEVEL